MMIKFVIGLFVFVAVLDALLILGCAKMERERDREQYQRMKGKNDE